jgi:hypothetical protein
MKTVLCCVSRESIQKNHYFKHINKESWGRVCTLLIPGLGNFLVWFADTYFSRGLRLCVFQHAENADCFEKSLIKFYKFFSQGICSIGYDAKRANQSRELLREFGAEFSNFKDDKHSLDTMRWHPADLEKKIQEYGGRWEKCFLDQESVFVIHPPTVLTENWKRLETLFEHLNWQKKDDLIITGLANENSKKLFIQLNSASTSMIMLQKKMGLFLGCKQEVVCFDPPGTGLSEGRANESAYYSAVKVVYDKFSTSYAAEDVWVCAACLGSLSAAYLKTQVPNINLLLENSFVSMKQDMVKPEGDYQLWFIKKYWEALNEEGTPLFNIEKLWKKVPKAEKGKIVVVNAKNDQRLSENVAKNLVSLAQKISPSVQHIVYHSPAKDPHFSRFDAEPVVRQLVLKSVFTS